MMLPAISQPIPEPTEHTINIFQGAPDTTQMPFPPILDPDALRYLADRQDDRTRQFAKEAQAARKFALFLRELAATVKDPANIDILALERQIGVDGLRRALQDLADPEDKFRDQLAEDHDAVAKDMGST